jgi:polyferredoxin
MKHLASMMIHLMKELLCKHFCANMRLNEVTFRQPFRSNKQSKEKKRRKKKEARSFFAELYKVSESQISMIP